jgi:hypothetical protein
LILLVLLPLTIAGRDKTASKGNRESFAGTIERSPRQPEDVLVVMTHETTSEDVKSLEEAFQSKGEAGLNRALGKMNKGFMRVEGNQYPLELAYSQTSGKTRYLTFIAERGQQIFTLQVAAIGNDYPYTCVQMELDESGEGKGTLIPYSKVSFKQGNGFQIENMSSRLFKLIGVHSVR